VLFFLLAIHSFIQFIFSTPRNDPNPRFRLPADHGNFHVPGAGDATHAPKSLDHFKRGYQERADMREREFYSQNKTKRGGGHAGGGGGGGQGRDYRDPWANRDRVTIINGLDCNRLLDELEATHDRRVIYEKLDRAHTDYPEGFESGKAITALVSAAARRQNTNLAYTIWEWVHEVKIPKNVFHYNAMIAVAATERNPEKALRFMEEMTRENIQKNEVT
jgi:pentatricopeptide repeat protein